MEINFRNVFGQFEADSAGSLVVQGRTGFADDGEHLAHISGLLSTCHYWDLVFAALGLCCVLVL